jgi:2-amino-4-hydroxy-6-hydroxymethyldihydropteridine diphosphokinase
MTNRIFLSLGSNIGNKLQNLNNAINALEENDNINIVIKSDIYKTSPMYNLDQNDFYNMVIEITTKLSPSELLGMIKFIELKLGRQLSLKRNMPRLIDIDILTFNDIVLNTKTLTIPHGKLSERRFVLLPWEEIASNFYIPKLKKQVKDILKSLYDNYEVVKLKKELI